MNLNRLLNEIELLNRCEVRYGISARLVAAALIADYTYAMLDVGAPEPPKPEWKEYRWPRTGRVN